MPDEHWTEPEGGSYAVAVRGTLDAPIRQHVEDFFGRRLATYNHHVTFETTAYIVFFFALRSDAERCIRKFGGEWFDVRDKGRGQHWSQWYKGRAAKREKNRSPYL